MTRLRELPAIGLGLAPSPGVRGAAKALTWRERLRARSRVRAGRAAWDAPSARYAIEVARVHQRISQPFGRLGATRSRWFLAAIMWLNVLLHATDGDGALEVTLFVVAAIAFSLGALRLPAWDRNAPKAEALNRPLLGGAVPSIDVAPNPTRRLERAGMVMAALLFGVPFGVGVGVGEGDWIVGAGGGVVFGAFMVVGMRWLHRRGARR